MPWIIGGGILYIVLMVTLGIVTLRHHHGWMFFFGLFFPIMWLVGAIAPDPRMRRY